MAKSQGVGFELLDRSPDDEAQNLYPLQAPGGTIVRITARQIEIMSMPAEAKIRVPQIELIELGKLLMEASQSNIDEVLQSMDENPPDMPEFVSEA